MKTLKPPKPPNFALCTINLKRRKKVKTRAHLFITGRVHGVFFRSETKHNANRYDVKGWVRNLPDMRVEAVFEGEKDAVQTLIDFCKHGPSGAKVTSTDLTWEVYTGKYDSFTIKYGYH